MGLNGWGSPKVTRGQPKSFVVLYKYRRVRCREGLFPKYICESMLYEELFPFAIKNYKFPIGESLVEYFIGGIFQMLFHGFVECELFCFQLVSINCEIVIAL